MEKEAKQNKHVKVEAKKTNKIKVSGQVHAYTWTSLHAHNQACVTRQDNTHASSCPENPRNVAKLKTLNLTT